MKVQKQRDLILSFDNPFIKNKMGEISVRLADIISEIFCDLTQHLHTITPLALETASEI
jgi:hypothetical protein